MKKFGLIGHPVSHSLSPALFRAGYGPKARTEGTAPTGTEAAIRQPDGQGTSGEPAYCYDLIDEEDFDRAYRKFLDEYDGINVTAPFKEQAFGKADIIDPVCRKIGATNLLVKTPEGVAAYNSDYYGIILSILAALDRNCKVKGLNPSHYNGHDGKTPEINDRRTGYQEAENGPSSSATVIQTRSTPEDCRKAVGGRLRTALVVGCGGAGKAAAVAAGDLGLETVLMNRTAARAEAIAAALPEYGFKVRPIEDFRDCFAAADLILYTLPAPLEGIAELADSDYATNSSITDRDFNTTDRTPFGNTYSARTAEKGYADTGNMGHRRKILLEANYRNPSFREELTSRQMSVHKDFTYIPGHQWLLYQAYAGYDLFTGETPDLLSMAKIIM